MGDEQNGQAKSRLERLEHLMELLIDDHLKFSDEHNRLLKAQVLLTEAQQQAEARMDGLNQKMAELAEAQKHTDERMDALITVVDALIRKPQSS
jgi:uncharacterized protein with von Willebrand factor type A (vWA) domain